MTARVVEKSEINITPFIDVMLVLLIVFMVAAPLATTHVKLTIPPPSDVRVQPAAVFVSLRRDGTIYVGSQRFGERAGDWHSLASLLRANSNGNFGMPVFVRADSDVGYGDVMRLIDEVHAAGYTQVSIVTEDHSG